MSVHVYQSFGKPVDLDWPEGVFVVSMGWDHNTSRFYCNIWEHVEGLDFNNTDTAIYHSSIDGTEQSKTLGDYLKVCNRFGLNVPGEMVKAVLSEERSACDNVIREWS